MSQRILESHGEDEVEVAIIVAITTTQLEEILCDDVAEVVSGLDAINVEGNIDISYVSLPLTNEKLLPLVQQALTA